MKFFALIFGIVALMLNISLSSLSGLKKCRKLIASSNYTTILNKEGTKDQTHNSETRPDGTCNNLNSIIAIEQIEKFLFIVAPAKELTTATNNFYNNEYINPPFAPPRQQKKLF